MAGGNSWIAGRQVNDSIEPLGLSLGPFLGNAPQCRGLKLDPSAMPRISAIPSHSKLLEIFMRLKYFPCIYVLCKIYQALPWSGQVVGILDLL